MKALFGLVALGVIVLALVVSPSIKQRLDDRNDYQRSRELLQLEEQHYQFERQRQWDAATAPANLALYYASGAGGLVFFALVLHFVHQGKERRAREHELVDVQGYPLARRRLETGDGWTLELMARALEIDKRARLAEASRPIPPAHLSYTYAPKISGQAAPQLVDEPEAALERVPTFAELLARGDVAAGRPLVLGAGASGLVTGSFRDLYSTLVAGQSGSGKSTSQRFFASQASLHGARHIVIDPHADAGEDSLAATLDPLSGLYVCNVADSERAILEAVKLARDIGEKRLHGQDRSRAPILVWVDEATGLLAHSKIGPELAELLEIVAQQLRKVGIYCSVSAQIVTASRTGGDSALRDSMASVICHKMRRSQARLILPLDDAATVERLEPGRAVLWRTSGASELIGIPQTTSADCAEVARRLQHGAQPTVETAWQGFGKGLAINDSAAERPKPQDAQSARVLAMFASGADIPQIAREVYGATTGRKYTESTAEINRIIRDAIRGS